MTLTDLDGSGTLDRRLREGRSARRARRRSNTGSGFIYTRDQDQFEQVMAYYWVTQAQRYIQSLGFGSTSAVNKRQQLLRIDQFGGDNCFYRDGTKKLTITLGKGGVDDAEDAEVIVHEYGHSVQDDQVPGFGSTPEAGAIGEALRRLPGRHRVARTTRPRPTRPASPTGTRPRTRRRRRTACAASTARSIYPRDLEGEVHADGEIWSASLWAFRGAVGPAKADRRSSRRSSASRPDTSMPAAAATTIATAQRLYGTTVATAARRAFAAHGLA